MQLLRRPENRTRAPSAVPAAWCHMPRPKFASNRRFVPSCRSVCTAWLRSAWSRAANEDEIPCPPLCRSPPGFTTTASRDGCACACWSCRHGSSVVMCRARYPKRSPAPATPRWRASAARPALPCNRRTAPKRCQPGIHASAYFTHAAAVRQFSPGLRACRHARS